VSEARRGPLRPSRWRRGARDYRCRRMDQVLDLILLTHNRLAHLVATVDALEERTRSPYRLTIVDNASGPEVRNWLAANRARFHGLVLLAENEFLPALNHAIPETTSDPFIVTDPDLIVPEPDGDRC